MAFYTGPSLSPLEIIPMTADQTFTPSSIVLQDVTELVKAIGVDEIWAFELFCLVDSGLVPDIKVGFASPAGATIDGRVSYDDPALAPKTLNFDESSVITLRSSGAGVPHPSAIYTGIITNGGTAGDLQIQAAQGTSDPSDTKLLKGSYLKMVKLV